MTVSAAAFYENSIDALRPGDIIYLSDWPPYGASYWAVLTSYCDLERRDHVLLSKIEPLASANTGLHGQARKFQVFYMFYLPPVEREFGESFVDYGMVYPFSRDIIKAALNGSIRSRRICSLTTNARRLFHYHFANHITRNSVDIFKSDIEGILQLLDGNTR